MNNEELEKENKALNNEVYELKNNMAKLEYRLEKEGLQSSMANTSGMANTSISKIAKGLRELQSDN